MPKKWFHNWFSSPYYHILYHQHGDTEAEFFIDNLCSLLKPDVGARLLGVGCGRGQHSIYLNKKGYDITGIDPSLSNISFAKQFENNRLHFYAHDMRNLFYVNYFDIAFNLFASFGYFETDYAHLKSLKAINKTLKPDGLLVLDYFNSFKIQHSLNRRETKTIDGIDFNIHKKFEDGSIVKTITFEHKAKAYAFKEDVRAFGVDDFNSFFAESGFEVVHCFGNYSLDEFDLETSDRLIFICRKPNA